MKNWKCKIGLHDWVVLKSDHILMQYLYILSLYSVVENKICIRCGKCVDKLDQTLKRQKEEYVEICRKFEIAKEMWDNEV